MNGILDSNYKELMRYQIARARFYYKQAARGIPMLSPEGRLPVQVSDSICCCFFYLFFLSVFCFLFLSSRTRLSAGASNHVPRAWSANECR